MDQYKLGVKFCRESLKNGGVSIFVHDILQCTNIIWVNLVRNKTLKHVQLGFTYHP